MSIDCDLRNCGRLSPRDISSRFSKLMLIAVGLVASGCGKPSETTRDNRRLMDAILTAVTIRDSKELSNDQKLLNVRRDAGKLSKKAYSILRDAISQAEAGEWATAEKQLYEFRKQTPFPK